MGLKFEPNEDQLMMLLAIARESLKQFGTILPPKELLYRHAKAECPHCGHIGSLETDFGFRTVANGDRRPQSWCKGCRASPDSHPRRKQQ